MTKPNEEITSVGEAADRDHLIEWLKSCDRHREQEDNAPGNVFSLALAYIGKLERALTPPVSTTQPTDARVIGDADDKPTSGGLNQLSQAPGSSLVEALEEIKAKTKGPHYGLDGLMATADAYSIADAALSSAQPLDNSLLVEALTKPISMQDIRLVVGEGKLPAWAVRDATNTILRARAREALASSPLQPPGSSLVEALRQLETVRHYLHMQIGKPLKPELASAPEIALDQLKSILRAASPSTEEDSE